MFKIDFLKGKGLPTKSRPLDAAIIALSVVAVVFVGGMLGIQYFANVSAISLKQKAFDQVESLMVSSPAGDEPRGRISVYQDCYGEVAYSVRRYVQWTPVLREIAETLPSTMILNGLNASRSVSKEKVTSKFDVKKKVDIQILNRRLKAR